MSPCSPKAKRQQTFSDRVSELVLNSCKASEPNAAISSVLRDSYGRTVVRVRCNTPSCNTFSLLNALQKSWPLAKTSVVENALDGSVEAEIVVPSEEDEVVQARMRALSTRLAELSWMLAVVLLLVGVSLYVTETLSRYHELSSDLEQ